MLNAVRCCSFRSSPWSYCRRCQTPNPTPTATNATTATIATVIIIVLRCDFFGGTGTSFNGSCSSFSMSDRSSGMGRLSGMKVVEADAGESTKSGIVESTEEADSTGDANETVPSADSADGEASADCVTSSVAVEEDVESGSHDEAESFSAPEICFSAIFGKSSTRRFTVGASLTGVDDVAVVMLVAAACA